MGPESRELLEAINLANIFFALILLIGAVAVSRSLGLVKVRFGREFPQFRQQIEQWTTVFRFLILVSGVLIAMLALFGFSKQTIIAIGGSAAIAIGFGFKDIAASVLSGFIILFERPFQVGDRVKFAEIYGDVVSIGLRSIRVRTLDDSSVTIPNSRFITDPVSSANAGGLDMMAQVDLHVSSDANLTLVRKLAREAVIASRYTYLSKSIVVLFSDVFVEQYFCTRVRIKAYIIDIKYEKPFESDITERLHEAFAKYGVSSPHRLGVQHIA